MEARSVARTPSVTALGALAAVAIAALLAAPAPVAHAIGAGGSPPINTAPPVVTGTPQAGQTLGCSQGTWSDSPFSFAYHWNRDGVAVTADSATGSYLVGDADAGKQLTCTVTATNVDGSGSATSSAVLGTARPAAPVISPPTGPPALPKAADVIDLPSAKRCASRRRFRLRVRRLTGVKFTSVAVFVNGKRVKVLKGERVMAPVDLRGLPAGKFAAKIVVTTSDKRTLTHSRKYRTCAAKRGGKRRHRL